jgi:predicted nucleotidyltransferase component of viral defense system
MSQLFWNTISEDMRFILNEFFKSEIAEKFYLAGGTALSLQLGHRQSIDLDFFSTTEDIPTIRQVLIESLIFLETEIADTSWGNLVLLTNGVRVGFYGYGYALVNPLVEYEKIQLASVEDIALMKMDALLSRASRKDFYDLYFICQNIPVATLFSKAHRKYPSIRDFEVQVTKRLVYFETAELDTDPILLNSISWQEVKDYFIQQAKEIEKSWLT